MPKTTKSAARPKKTKAEIEEEFSQIRQEVEAAREGAGPKWKSNSSCVKPR
jgi:hypothetical protein